MTTETHLKNAGNILSRHGIADTWFNPVTNHHSLYATLPFDPMDVIANFYAGITQNYPTYLTVQVGKNTHITLEPVFLQYINHSCDPNVFFDTAAMKVICVKPIQPGDELVFFYPSAEWEMAQPFLCNCGSKNCLQLINGAAHLSTETLSRYLLTEFILQKIKQKNIV